MNRQLASAVVDFLARPAADGAGPLARFSQRQWCTSMHWLVTSGLALYLLQELKRARRLDVVPNATQVLLENMWSGSETRVRSLEATLLDLNRRFAAAGLRFANWKGFAAVPDFCPDARLRAFSDFDFFVEPNALKTYDAILTACGYTNTGEGDGEFRYDRRPGALTHFLKSYDDAPSRIELHTRLNSTAGGYRVPSDPGLLQRRVLQCRRDTPFPVLDPADAFVLHAMHATRHFLDGWLRVAWLLEMCYFVQHHDSDAALWQEVRTRAQQMPRCTELVGIAVWLSSSLFPSDAARCLAWAMESVPPRIVQWLQRFGRTAALAEFPGTKLPLMLNRELFGQSSWVEFESAKLLPIKRPQRISRPQDSSFRQHAIAAAWQTRYVCSRLRFHFIEGARYKIAKRRWDRALVASADQQTSLIS